MGSPAAGGEGGVARVPGLRLALCSLAALLLVDCQPPAPDGGDSPPATERPAPEADMPATASDSLRLWLEVPDEVRAGEPVAIAFHVENITDRPLDLYLTGRPIAFDLIVTDADGAVVWRRLEDEIIAAILQIRTLGPGETLALEDSWDQRSNAGEPVAPGAYTVRGELLAEEEPLVTPVVPLRIRSG